MSTQYLLVNAKVAEQTQAFQEQLDVMKVEYLSKIQQIPISQELVEVRDRLIEKISTGHVFEIDEPDDTRFVIGTARANKFQWRYENGFYDLFTVRRWLERWPEFTIIDEYGAAVSPAEFTDIIRQYPDEPI